ncbi:MAG: Na-Ca exchanger/integrin-beta4 [Acidobacteria bacterium]|nr:Na-Ca exchanger/integrin-beta4 [Acidobacteriota bacterium]
MQGSLIILYQRIPATIPSLRRKGKLIRTAVVTCGAFLISLFVINLFTVHPRASGFTATTFTVTSAADSGAGTLRQAILDSNSNAGTDTIAFNIPGPGVHTISPVTALPTLDDPVVIDGYTQPGSSSNTLANGDNAVLLIELSGNNIAGMSSVPGLQIMGSNCTVRGLVINRFGFGAGIYINGFLQLSSGNVIEGNFIGTDPAGTIRHGNSEGVEIQRSTNNLIGGTSPAARNVISVNDYGIRLITGASATTIQGNFIGTNASGTAVLGNDSGGIYAGGNGSDVIGGTTDGARNVIAGDQNNAGIYVASSGSSGATIQGNLIGTDVTGTIALGNFFGIWLNFGGNSTIGGLAPGARNVISGNRSDGVRLSGQTSNNQIQGNLIGTDITGTKPLGNALNGIHINESSANNRVGGTVPGQGNTIAFNGRNGVLISFGPFATGNSIRRNSIFSNGLMGIDLGADGVTPNDQGDGDSGPNNLQNFPLITSVTSDSNQTTITGTLNSTPSTSFNINFYSSSTCDPSGNGEGTTVLAAASIPITTDNNGNASFGVAMSIPLGAGQAITATATDPAGNTSEFSPCDAGNATGSVQFTTSSLRVIEDVGFVTVNLIRTGGSKGVLAVDYTTADITATAGADYVPASGTLVFNDGETSKTFDIPILDDANTEPDETFLVRLQNGPNIDSIGTPGSELITLQDHSTPPVLSISNVSVNEGDSGTTNALFTVTLSPLTGRTVTVQYQTNAGTATSNVDFQPVSGTLTFGPRQSTPQQISVPIIGDTFDEFNESFQVVLSNPSGATFSNGVATATGIILDNDPPPIVSISDVVVVEGNGASTPARFNLSLSQISGKSICVQASTADGTATAASGDFIQVGGAIFNPPANIGFNPGTTTATFTVQVTGDFDFEPKETFLAQITPCNGDITIGRGQAVGTIINDDVQVPPSISISDVGVSDGNGAANAVFDVALSTASTQTVTVQYATSGGTATAGSDFQSVAGTLTFAPGVTHQAVTVPIIPDSTAEGNETFSVNLSNPDGGTLADSEGLGTISDGPPSGLPFLTIRDVTVVEGASGTSLMGFAVTLSQPSTQQVFFQYNTAPGTATQNVDYLSASGGIVIAPGVTRTGFQVTIIGDQIPEADETLFANISNATGATIADSQGVGTIVNYVTPSIQFSSGNVVTEDAATFTTTITRTGNSLTTSTIEVATTDGSARQRADYTISGAAITFLPGETSKIFNVPIVNDVYVEGDETFNLTLSNPSGAVVGGQSTAVVTILDDDSSPPVFNPLDNADARFFVRQHYYDFLSRVPDQSGFDFWSGVITQCNGDPVCLRTKRVDVSNAFFYELEFQQTGAYVYRQYRAAFGNNQPSPNPVPDPAHPDEEKKLLSYQAFANDRARVIGGKSLAQAQLDLANAFVQRPEFLSKYPAGLNAQAFVDSLLNTILTDIGVNLGLQRQALIDLFFEGGRGAVLYRLADDNVLTNPINNRAFINAEYNRAFVATQYFGYLRRNPDMAGFVFWLNQVNGAPLRDVARQHAMVCSFITSTEYQQRFSPVVSHSNTECQ